MKKHQTEEEPVASLCQELGQGGFGGGADGWNHTGDLLKLLNSSIC